MTREAARQFFASKILEGYGVLGWQMTETERRLMDYDLLSEDEADRVEEEAEQKGIDATRLETALSAAGLKKDECKEYLDALSDKLDPDLKYTIQGVLYGHSYYTNGERRMFRIFKWFLIVLGLLITREWLMNYWKKF